jgi:hypothetical protein
MSRPMGGLTGFGYGSLGGLLIGGVKKENMTTQQLAAYEARLQQQKLDRALLRQTKGLAPYIRRPVGSPKKVSPTAHARNMLKRLIDAENMAAEDLIAQGHPQYADVIDEDMAYNINLRDSGRRPKWLLDKYSGRPGRELYEPVKPGAFQTMSTQELQARKEALRGAPIWKYTSASGTVKLVKEGSSEFNRISQMKGVRDGTATFERVQ